MTRVGVVMPLAADSGEPGAPTRGQARGRRWRRAGRNLFVPADVDASLPDQRIVEAVVGTPGSAATGWAGLHWLGARWFDGRSGAGEPLEVPLATGDRRGSRRRPAARLSEDWLFADDVIVIDGLPVTVPERSVSWEVRRSYSLERAVQAIDMAAYDDLIDLASFAAYVAHLPARPGIKLLREALGMASENAWSPMESTMRVRWLGDERRARLLCNAPVFNSRGAHLLTPDLLDPIAGVVGEYNGSVHDGDAPRGRDLDKEEQLKRLGLESVTMMRADLRDPGRFLGRLAGAYRRAADRAQSPRLWTLEQPDWWLDTSTVAARRALTADQQARWLGYRVA